ncbi:MAG: hypothetical protein CBD27_04975 [Rhodospirillaceae bacterium TMED167]|nr:hypothetical protein [Rhodospirillaceae bacterium]OUW28138.1 MAG: hypothetical protein CBD27_04975 [Rhodospirillaceae bacterium TMED167]
MLILYDNPFSTNAQKVRLVMAEKGIAYESNILDLQAGDQFDPDFMKLNPAAQVPTLRDGDKLFTESTVISEYLEDAYPGPPLMPGNPARKAEVRWLTEQTISWMSPMINSLNVGLVFRHIYAGKSAEEMAAFWAANSNPIQLQRQRSCAEEGVNSPYIPIALRRYRTLILKLNARLENAGPWLAGEMFSLADTGLFPYLNRLDVMGFERLTSGAAAYADWLDAMRSRPSVQTEITDKIPKNALAAHREFVARDQSALDGMLAELGV